MEEGSFLDIGRLGILHQGGSQDSQERPAEAGILLQKVVRFLVLNFSFFAKKKLFVLATSILASSMLSTYCMLSTCSMWASNVAASNVAAST